MDMNATLPEELERAARRRALRIAAPVASPIVLVLAVLATAPDGTGGVAIILRIVGVLALAGFVAWCAVVGSTVCRVGPGGPRDADPAAPAPGADGGGRR